MNNKSFSRYRNINSFIHSIDPRIKIISFLLIVVSTFFAQSIATLLIVFSFVLITALFSNLNIKSYFKIFYIIIPFFIIMTILYLFASWNWNDPIPVLVLTGEMSIRFYELILLATILTTTTREMDIAAGLEFIISPLRYIKVPTYEISMMLMLSIRFIPILLGDLYKILVAQTSRGVNVINGGFFTKIKGIKNSLLPMMIIAFKRADDMSMSMTMRGYKIGKKRSKYKDSKFELSESLVLFLSLTLLFLIIYFQFFTYFGDIG